MTTILRPDHFSGSAKVFTRDPGGLSQLLRGVAIDSAVARLRQALFVAEEEFTDLEFTDSSTGTAAATLLVPPVPQAALSCWPRVCRAAASSGKPRTTVTALPPRPEVSRRTRTRPSPSTRAAAWAWQLQRFCG